MKRLICWKNLRLAVLLVAMLVLLAPTEALASSSLSAQSSDKVGDMYDVASALSSFTNNVVGVNANEKYSGQKLTFLKGVNSGNAGGVVGYGDPKKGFLGYLASPSTNATTVSSYEGWYGHGSDGLNDGRTVYKYVVYGHLLSDLGVDHTGSVNGDTMRSLFGKSVSVLLNIGAFVPKVFNFTFDVLRFINPFSYLLGATVSADDDHGGFFGFIIGQYVGIYKGAVALGEVALILTLGLLIGYVLLARNAKDKSSRALTWIKRFVFVIIGIPLLGALYSAALDNLNEISSKPAAGSVVGSTFVDFKKVAVDRHMGWYDSITANLSANSNGDLGSGYADISCVRNLRGVVLSEGASGITAGSFSPELGDWRWLGTPSPSIVENEDGKTVVEFPTNGFSSDDNIAILTDLLSRYSSSDMYLASDWHSEVSSIITGGEYSSKEIGHAGDNSNPASNSGTINAMFSYTDEPKDWEDREVNENNNIMTGALKWAGGRFSIFDGGGLTPDTEINGNSLTYGASDGGLSHLAMYNYLSTEFADSYISVQSTQNSTSRFTQIGHYSVNMIGSGILHIAYGLNVIVVLFVMTAFGYVYAFGMIVSLLKRSLHLVFQIPFAAVGILKSIVQVVTYVVMMICEILFTFLLYDVVTSFLYGLGTVFADVFGGAYTESIVGAGDTGVLLANARFVFATGIVFASVLIFVFGQKTWKYRRSLLCFVEYCMCRVWRVATLPELRPAFDEWMALRESLYPWDFNLGLKVPVVQTVPSVCVAAAKEVG